MPEPAAAAMLRNGQVVGNYRVLELIGRGGMGEVYLAEDMTLERRVAMKVLPASFDQTRAHRFIKEAKLLAKVEHPNVVRIYTASSIRLAGRAETLHYMILEYVQGKDLTDIVESCGGPLPWREAVDILKSAAQGLAAIHAIQLIHRDIKPSNIMRASNGRVLVMDFGLAREELVSDMTPTGAILGTPAFMAPEQCSAKARIDHRCDIFSLGGTLYYLLTKQRPFAGEAITAINSIRSGKMPVPVDRINTFVPKRVADLVKKMMAHRPADRYPSAEAVIAAIDDVLRQEVPAPTASWDTQDRKGAGVDTFGGEDVPEIVPEEDEDGEARPSPIRTYLPYAVAGGGMLLALIALIVVLVAVRNTGTGPVGSGTKPAVAGTLPSKPSTPAVATQPDRGAMVKIPAGPVWLGNDQNKLRQYVIALPGLGQNAAFVSSFMFNTTHEPHERTYVPAFSIDKYEVTRAEYARFLAATQRTPPKGWSGSTPPAGTEKLPVTNVSHDDALAYATWAGKKLPTAAQWLRAFRGEQETLFPWGDRWEPNKANVIENNGRGPLPVDANPSDVTPLGVYNMVGNVSEMLRELDRTLAGAVITKGANFGGRGSCLGVGSFIFPWSPELAANDAVGFRCVIEEP